MRLFPWGLCFVGLLGIFLDLGTHFYEEDIKYNTTCIIEKINCHTYLGGFNEENTYCDLLYHKEDEEKESNFTYKFSNTRYTLSFIYNSKPTNDALKYFRHTKPSCGGSQVPWFIFIKEENQPINVTCLYSTRYNQAIDFF